MTNTQLTTTRYHATFELDEFGNWIAQVTEIPQVHTFGRTLGKAREYLVDALALWLSVPLTRQGLHRLPTSDVARRSSERRVRSEFPQEQ